MKLSSILLTTLVLSSAGAEAQTEVHHTTTKKDTSKVVLCGTAKSDSIQIDSVKVIKAKKIKKKTRHNCPGCGLG